MTKKKAKEPTGIAAAAPIVKAALGFIQDARDLLRDQAWPLLAAEGEYALSVETSRTGEALQAAWNDVRRLRDLMERVAGEKGDEADAEKA